MPPIPLRIEIADIQAILPAVADRGHGTGNLAGDECLATDRAFVIEQDAIRSMHAISLTVVDRDPMGIELRCCIGAARIEGRGFSLGRFQRHSEQFRGRGLIEPHMFFHSEQADRLQESQCSDTVDVGRIFEVSKLTWT